MLKRLRDNKGFTLIELMLVVAIIATISAIAMPQFLKYQAKTKQAEARVNLAGIWSAETAYLSENNGYGRTFTSIGFALAGGGAAFYDFTIEPPSGGSWASGAWSGVHGTPGDGPPTGAVINLNYLPGVSNRGFTALAAANIDNDPEYDTWTISSDKNLENHWNDVQ